jgi:tetratricopeptide (TPR) repeat protein
MLNDRSSSFLSTVAAADRVAGKLRILLVVSQPIDETARINAGQEVRHLYQQLSWSRVPAALIKLNPPTWGYLQTTLLTRQFDVVHFIGHGKNRALQLEKEDGSADWIPTDDLVPLFRDSGVKLVILNNCSSEPIGDSLVAENVPAVIATSRSVHSDVALLLSGPLYSALAAGRSLKSALEIVKRTIQRERGERNALPFTALGPNSDVPIVDSPLTPGDPEFYAGDPCNNLPPNNREGFFDRITEHLLIHKYLSSSRSPFIGISGIVGSGKSTVAIATACRYGWRFPRGIAYASLRSMRPFNLATLLSHLDWGLEDVPSDRQLTVALYELAKGPVLLVLDDLEVVTEQESGEVIRLLKSWDISLGGRAILVMRNRRPEFDQLIGGNWISVGDFPAKEALDFFTDQLGGIQIAEATLGASLARVPSLCHFHPKLLALTAAALQIGVPWDELCNQLEHLAGSTVTQLVNVLERSVSKVEKEAPLAGQFLDCWPAFANAATEEAWRFVLSGKQADQSDPLYSLQSGALAIMQRADILHRFQSKDQHNCRLHPLVSEFVHLHRWTQLTEEKREEYRHRHLMYYVESLRARQDAYPINAEWNNISLALTSAEKSSSWADLLALCVELVGSPNGVLINNGYWNYSKDSLLFALRAADELKNVRWKCIFLYNLGICRYRLAEYQDALTAVTEGYQISDLVGEKELRLDLIRELGRIHYRLGQYDLAREEFSRLLTISEHAEDQKRTADALHELGRLGYRQKDVALAEQLLSQALSKRETILDKLGIARTLHEIGRLYHAAGNFDQAETSYNRSLTLRKELRDLVGQQATIHQLGLLEVDRGSYAVARVRYDECASLANALNDRFWIAHNYYRYADLYWREDNKSEALALGSKALDLCRVLGITLERDVEAWMASRSTI